MSASPLPRAKPTTRSAGRAGRTGSGERSPRTMLRGIATVIGLAGFVSPVVYLILIFMPGYAVRELKLEQTVPMLSTLISSALLVLLLVMGIGMTLLMLRPVRSAISQWIWPSKTAGWDRWPAEA